MTYYHNKYWAAALSLKRSSNSMTGLSKSIANAKVDLNPHQVHAALFALKSPLSRGAILADEVGLGKTIEAGLVIAQSWAEKKRKILLITPAFLRKQWQAELEEKFCLPCRIAESKNNSFHTERDEIVICSYQFAAHRADELETDWDLVVIDEAHRLRNVYKASNKQARSITDALRESKKLLLTATPLQNNLMELYGLISVIDPFVFGDEASFRNQFLQTNNSEERNRLLKGRIEPLIVRTLRKHVQEYIPFTKRFAITQKFTPNDDEQELYESVSAYLQRANLAALPNSQRALITLVLRKLLASSSFAITSTLETMIKRLEKAAGAKSLLEELDRDQIEALDDELIEKLQMTAHDPEVQAEKEKIRQEADELRSYLHLAQKIQKNSKGESLLIALQKALQKAEELGAARKAVIFTESVRTQKYLYDLLIVNGYADQVIRINGSNNDPESKVIFDAWLREQSDSKLRSSKAVETKAALVNHFRHNATILLATEAAAEGINLQFASLIVNYDLPWNPQRIEQRIGRCHRYGQKHDVVVVNFVNTKNEADQRVFELLDEKFKLFDGVFGASDEVLGAIESGVDIEMRIHQVYQTCRSPEEIQLAFDQLRSELDEQIQSNMKKTRESILDHFDEEVSSLLKTCQQEAQEAIGQRDRWLFRLACSELDQPISDHPFFVHQGVHFCMNWRLAEEKQGVFFREDHPLALEVIKRAKDRQLDYAHLKFNYSKYPQKISRIEPFIGRSGWLEVSVLSIDTFEREEVLLFSGITEDGEAIDSEILEKFFHLDANVTSAVEDQTIPSFERLRERQLGEHVKKAEEHASELYENEVEKLDLWSEDLKQGLERELKQLDKEIRAVRKTGSLSKTLAEKLENQKKIKNLESVRSSRRRNLFSEQDKIDLEREQMIERHQKRLNPRVEVNPLFIIRWSVH